MAKSGLPNAAVRVGGAAPQRDAIGPSYYWCFSLWRLIGSRRANSETSEAPLGTRARSSKTERIDD
eukprot:scaffold214284_cov17-Prasinocladus_malaysianus.AAC.1